jgi:uncharacterized protein (DUF1499 family)
MKLLVLCFQQLFVILLMLHQHILTCRTAVTAALHLQYLPRHRTTTTRQSRISSLRHSSAAESSPCHQSQEVAASPRHCWKTSSSAATALCAFFLSVSLLLLQPLPVHAADTAATAVTVNAIGRDSIVPCNKLAGAAGADAGDSKYVKNCVSTASVRQLDLYTAPWTFAGSLTNAQVLEYLQQALRDVDRLVEMETPGDKNGDDTSNALRAVTTRAGALAKDQLDFYINRNDRVIQFVSRQVDGPDVSDLGVNRKRLEEVRRKTPFGIMGVDDSADGGASSTEQVTEGALGQLKAFYGLQSGSGFEDVYAD